MTYFMGELVECFEEQKPGSFWSAKDLLIQSAMRGSYDETTARSVASQIGVNYNTALSCSSNAKQVYTDVALANTLSVQSTPTVLIRYGNSAPQYITYNGQTFNRGGTPYEAIQAAVITGNAG